MPRYALTVEYDGTPYRGFQSQTPGPTVQDAIEAAVLRFSGETIRLRAAGRTDTGVHATGQVVHVDLVRDWPAATVRNALNFHLRDADERIVVIAAAVARDGFDARFSAIGRRYLYRIVDRDAPLALDRDRAWQVPEPLDVEAMRAAAGRLVGHHDFTTFRAARCQSKSPVKTLDRLEVTREDGEVRVRAAARSFLHNQVRSMVGALKVVGTGRWTPDDVTAALEARDRTRCAALAPPWGLYLTRVLYPGDTDD